MCLDRSCNDRRWWISSVLSGLSSGRVFIHSPSHKEMGGNRDAQSQTTNMKRVHLWNNQTITPNGVKTFTFRLGTATSVLSMEDVDNWWSWSEWEGGMSQNIIYLYFKKLSSSTSANHFIPLQRLSIYFYVVSSSSINKRQKLSRAQRSWFMHCV